MKLNPTQKTQMILVLMQSRANNVMALVGLMKKSTKIVVRNPVAKAMLQERKPPQTILPKKGNKQEYKRQQFKQQQQQKEREEDD